MAVMSVLQTAESSGSLHHCSGMGCFLQSLCSRRDIFVRLDRWVQTCRMSSTGGGTSLTQRNYRLASDADKLRTTGTAFTLHTFAMWTSWWPPEVQILEQSSTTCCGYRGSSIVILIINLSLWFGCLFTGVVNDRLLSDYLHHVFPSCKPGLTPPSLR